MTEPADLTNNIDNVDSIDSPNSKNKILKYKVAIAINCTLVVLLAAALIYFHFGPKNQSNVAVSIDIPAVVEDPRDPPTPEEIRIFDAIKAGGDPADPNLFYLPTPVVAQYGDIKLHLPISVNNLTEIEFHRASNKWTLPLTPLIPIADASEVEEAHGTIRPPAEEQPTGDEIMIASAVSMDRDDSSGPMDSCIDSGALPGTAVYAPISGTVVLIRSYQLFDELEDIELHIQQKDHPELDFILLHIENTEVEVGDKVIAGVTKLASVRNIGDVIDNQLMLFTKDGDMGNHAHLQINDTRYPNYSLLKDALNIFED